MSRLRPILLAATLAALPAVAQNTPQADAQKIEAGRVQFEARCAGCHGGDATGGERGPNIVDRRRGRSTPIREIVRTGIPEAGMPAFQLTESEMESIEAFVASQSVPASQHPVEGDARAGEAFFNGAGKCSGCHMVRGSGGVVGPDLTNLARDRKLTQIEQALRASSPPSPGYTIVSVKLKDGRSIRGLAKNESIYDIQIQGLDGRFYLLNKADITSETREPKPLMPPVQASGAALRNLMAYLTRLTRPDDAPIVPATTADGPGGVTTEEINHPKPGEWPTYNGKIGGNRYSELSQIRTSNVSQLAAKWIFTVPNVRRLEVTPVVANGVMYVTSANEAYALDAANGRPIWRFSRPLTKGVIGDAAGSKNRGVGLLGDKVFMVTDNAHVLALHRLNGQILWETEMADSRKHYGATSAPLVAGDLVLSGTSGGDEGARGFLAAYNASTGKEVWRFWTMPLPGEPLASTWGGRAIEHGCGTAWLTGTYDPVLDLIYWPTGNPCPDYNGDERKGDNLYSASVVALERKTGKLRWYYQFTPHDLHDWDATEPPMLVDAEFHGRPRKLLMQANRNGFFYVLDRVTGEFLLGEPFVKNLTWASGIGKDGRPILIPGQEPTIGGNKTCPAVDGASNWMSTAYDPATKLFYVMAQESCTIYTKSSAWWEQGKSFYGGATRTPEGDPHLKVVRALDIQTGKLVWEFPQASGGTTWSGVLATAGGLLFFGEDSGAVAALDSKTGKSLWHFQTSQRWNASPMTYMVNGQQRIAMANGTSVLSFGLPDR